MISVERLLDETRSGQRTLPPELALRLLRASIRLAAGARVSLRPRMLLLDEDEDLKLDPAAASGDDDRPGYAAPEVSAGLAPPDDPQALVYTAGALGYELLTLRAVPERSAPASAGLTPAVAAVLRRALAPRHRRYPTLEEMDAELGPAASGSEDEHVPPAPIRPAALRLHQTESTHLPGALEEQLRTAEQRAAELERTLTARDIAAAEKIAELQLTIEVLQERVRLLGFLADAGAKDPHGALGGGRPPSGRRRVRPLVAVSTIVMVVAAIAASVLAIRGSGSSREPAPTPPDAELIQRR